MQVAGDQLRRDVTGLLPGSLYFFRVAAVNRMGRGPWSEATDMARIYTTRTHNKTILYLSEYNVRQVVLHRVLLRSSTEYYVRVFIPFILIFQSATGFTVTYTHIFYRLLRNHEFVVSPSPPRPLLLQKWKRIGVDFGQARITISFPGWVVRCQVVLLPQVSLLSEI